MKIKFKNPEKPHCVAENISAILDILKEVGIPMEGLTDRRLEKMAEACLAIGGIKESFSEVRSVKDGIFLKTREIITFENENFGEDISYGSYDDIRRKDLILLVQGYIAVNSSSMDSQATNDPQRGYTLSDPFAELLIAYGTERWDAQLALYKEKMIELRTELNRKRDLERIPVKLPSGKELLLGAGEHNVLQKAIIEEFLPLFGMGAEVLYVGDTSDKYLHREDEKLAKLGFFELEHDELPDVVAYNEAKNLLFLIEAYHSTGQWDDIRVHKVKKKLISCTANIVFFTAFENKAQFRSKASNIAWETEVWIADNPEHLVHFNGYKFLEIHK